MQLMNQTRQRSTVYRCAFSLAGVEYTVGLLYKRGGGCNGSGYMSVEGSTSLMDQGVNQDNRYMMTVSRRRAGQKI
jgi:hypothetical protein